MKNFIKLINWKAFIWEMLIIFAFLSLSYLAGNNKFPEKIWTVLGGTILIGIMVLVHIYLTEKIKEEKNNRGNRYGENN